MNPIEFFVPGIPKPGGSKTATVVRRKGGAVVMVTGASGASRPLIAMRDASNNRDWKEAVKAAALDAYRGEPLRDQPLRVTVEFHMPRPKAHYHTGKRAGCLRDDAPFHHTNKPDATKLLRCLEDALTGILWSDDSIIAEQHVTKRYAQKTGARVVVEIAQSE